MMMTNVFYGNVLALKAQKKDIGIGWILKNVQLEELKSWLLL